MYAIDSLSAVGIFPALNSVSKVQVRFHFHIGSTVLTYIRLYITDLELVDLHTCLCILTVHTQMRVYVDHE